MENTNIKHLTWIACNGVKPDLCDGTTVKQLFWRADEDITITESIVGTSDVHWGRVICYALEPKDAIQELLDAANGVLRAYSSVNVKRRTV